MSERQRLSGEDQGRRAAQHDHAPRQIERLPGAQRFARQRETTAVELPDALWHKLQALASAAPPDGT